MPHHKIIKMEIEFEVPKSKVGITLSDYFRPKSRASCKILSSQIISITDLKIKPKEDHNARAINEYKRVINLVIADHSLFDRLMLRGSTRWDKQRAYLDLKLKPVITQYATRHVMSFVFKEYDVTWSAGSSGTLNLAKPSALDELKVIINTELARYT